MQPFSKLLGDPEVEMEPGWRCSLKRERENPGWQQSPEKLGRTRITNVELYYGLLYNVSWNKTFFCLPTKYSVNFTSFTNVRIIFWGT